MGAAAAVAGGSVIGGLISSSGAKKAANTQAAAMDRAGERVAQAAEKAKGEILDRLTPALSEYRQGIGKSMDLIKQGGADVISILQNTTGNARDILARTGADAEKIMMGSRATTTGLPRKVFENQYRQIQKLPPEQRGQALSNIDRQIKAGVPMGYTGAIEAAQLGGIQAGQQLERGFGTARQDIETGRDTAIGRLGAAQDLIDRREQTALGEFSPYAEAGQAAIEKEAALSGALGPEAQAEAQKAFIESPGQQWLREQQEKALLRSSAAIGGLGGGQVRSALQEQAMGRAATMQQQHLENLRSLAGRGQQAAGSRAGIMQDITSLKTGLLSQDAQIRQQSAAQLAQISQQLGVSQADLNMMSASQISSLAERAGINLSQLASQQGTQQALLEQGLGQQVATQTGATAADLARLQESMTTGELNTQQNISQILSNLATQKGTSLGNIAIQQGQAQAAGQQAQANIWGQTAQGLGNIAAYGITQQQKAPPPPATTPQPNVGGSAGFGSILGP